VGHGSLKEARSLQINAEAATAYPNKGITMSETSSTNSFLRDVQTLREQARRSLEAGAVTVDYDDAEGSIEILQSALATEIVCVLRYTMNAISVVGINSKAVSEEFLEHAKDEREHMMMIAERIDQLGGKPNFDPKDLASRSATEYGHGGSLIEMVKENLVAERIAIEHYRDMIRYFEQKKDPSTRHMMVKILEDEEDHATDMHDLLVAHEGSPMLPD
jgi:bacterioferritin